MQAQRRVAQRCAQYLSGYIGGNYASNMNRFSKLYRVMVQAPAQSRLDTEALNNIFVRNDAGEMSPHHPISHAYPHLRLRGVDPLQPLLGHSGERCPGYRIQLGQAIQAVKEVAAQTLPTGYGFEFGGMSREESNTGNTTTLVFVICVVFIYSFCVPCTRVSLFRWP